VTARFSKQEMSSVEAISILHQDFYYTEQIFSRQNSVTKSKQYLLSAFEIVKVNNRVKLLLHVA